MNYRMLGYVLGRIFMVEAALLLPPSIVAVIYGKGFAVDFSHHLAVVQLRSIHCQNNVGFVQTGQRHTPMCRLPVCRCGT